MVVITNTGATFPVTIVSAACFELMVEWLTMFVFYDCLEPSVVIADFAEGLVVALMNKLGRTVEDGGIRGQVREVEAAAIFGQELWLM